MSLLCSNEDKDTNESERQSEDMSGMSSFICTTGGALLDTLSVL